MRHTQADRITSVALYHVAPRWLFLKLQTEDGYTGWGEPTIEGQHAPVAALIEFWAGLKDVLIGQDARRINYVLKKLYSQTFYHGGPVHMAAIAGIDMALWDIAGKRADLPCYSLWGGNATALETPAYTWFGGNDASPEEAAAQLDLEYKRGKRFFKMNACPPMGAIDAFNAIDQAVERLALARQTAPDARIALDWHGRLKPPEARRALERTDEFDVWFHEEPVLPKNYGVLAELHSRTSAKIALGERLTDLYQFRQVLQTGGVDILQPDLSHIGPTMGRKVAALAEAHDVGLTFHAPLGPINRTCSVHVGVTTDRYFFQECSEDMHYNDQGGSPENPPENRNGAYYLAGDSVEQYRLRDGRISIGSAPGLGLLMDEERIQAAAQDGHAWHDFMNARDLDNGLPTEW